MARRRTIQVDPSPEEIHDALDRIAAARKNLVEAKKRDEESIIEARKIGITWTEIAEVHGISRQGLLRKYKHLNV